MFARRSVPERPLAGPPTVAGPAASRHDRRDIIPPRSGRDSIRCDPSSSTSSGRSSTGDGNGRFRGGLAPAQWQDQDQDGWVTSPGCDVVIVVGLSSSERCESRRVGDQLM